MGTELPACTERMFVGPAVERLGHRQDLEHLGRELAGIREHALARVGDVHNALRTLDPRGACAAARWCRKHSSEPTDRR
ncbi:hypothetical protein AB0953_25350 [Streptomyces sp. NPDC046866]|uniref:hypothetical protein n=1 Tax=Streptomyces sp. NPDC046866 TaxID=3154921 RepID=UPI003452EE88